MHKSIPQKEAKQIKAQLDTLGLDTEVGYDGEGQFYIQCFLCDEEQIEKAIGDMEDLDAGYYCLAGFSSDTIGEALSA